MVAVVLSPCEWLPLLEVIRILDAVVLLMFISRVFNLSWSNRGSWRCSDCIVVVEEFRFDTVVGTPSGLGNIRLRSIRELVAIVSLTGGRLMTILGSIPAWLSPTLLGRWKVLVSLVVGIFVLALFDDWEFSIDSDVLAAWVIILMSLQLLQIINSVFDLKIKIVLYLKNFFALSSLEGVELRFRKLLVDLSKISGNFDCIE